MNDKDLLDFLAISGIRKSYLHEAIAFFQKQAVGDNNLFQEGKERSDREQRISYETLLKYLRIAADEPKALEILGIWRHHSTVHGRIRGDFHVHTEFSDGIDGTASLMQEAKRLGYGWIALCDHAPKASHSYTLSVNGFLRRAEIAAQASSDTGVKAYQAIEADILEDGSLNIPPEIRDVLDFALASFHYRYPLSDAKLLGLIESAFADDKVTGFAHPFFNLRPGQDDNLLLPILDLAEKCEVAVEINLAPYFLTDNLYLVPELMKRNLNILFSTDAHCRGALSLMRFAGLFLDGELDSRVLNFQTQPAW
jgi:histidinol phosphatase-like PHP family hydrolase